MTRLSIVILIAALHLIQQAYNDTQPWRDYLSRVESAYALEVHWTKTDRPASTVYHGQDPPKTRMFRLLFRKSDYLLLEEFGIARAVWNGADGISMDLRQKTWRKASRRPEFLEARFLALPFLPDTFSGQGLHAKLLQHESNKIRWNTVHFQTQAIDAGMIFDYTFNDRTKLIGLVQVEHRGMMKWTGTQEYRIQSFETDKMFLISEFSTKPPASFRESTATGCSDSNPHHQLS